MYRGTVYCGGAWPCVAGPVWPSALHYSTGPSLLPSRKTFHKRFWKAKPDFRRKENTKRLNRFVETPCLASSNWLDMMERSEHEDGAPNIWLKENCMTSDLPTLEQLESAIQEKLLDSPPTYSTGHIHSSTQNAHISFL
ncbi:hypothetical protein ILYODFUR_001807 [Ilyodon furcidens]|uniref:Uncharacterized protein n=1 Tax=Ilyodon furcidens TaxID=33524 RepID=A0ABV0STG7_9TELE